MGRDELLAGGIPQWKSAALLSLNLTVQRFGCVAFLEVVFTLVLNQICKSCLGKSCLSSPGKAPQNWLPFYWYRWQDYAAVSNTLGCGVLDAALCKKEFCVWGNAIWVCSGVAFFHGGHLFHARRGHGFISQLKQRSSFSCQLCLGYLLLFL